MNNKAAWLKPAKAYPEVDTAPKPKAGLEEVVIRNTFIGVNPVDWKTQEYSSPSQIYPDILGWDVAGGIIEVGPGITRLKLGQRVIAFTFVRKCCHFLGFPYLTITPQFLGQTILIWGGLSSVGGTAVQLAVASGLEVASTTSAKNLDSVKTLGAKHVIDYSTPTLVEEAINSLKGRCRRIPTVLTPPVDGLPRNFIALRGRIFGQKEVGSAIWGDCVPKALAAGKLLAKPDPIFIKGGLQHLQEALDTLKKGVSAAKVVVGL
ncbi:chaperonin 10-like protein [Xylogone sp. PMI_703]|nr:chaperonin 10-like protein [Xylogone sp. PMI_703]